MSTEWSRFEHGAQATLFGQTENGYVGVVRHERGRAGDGIHLHAAQIEFIRFRAGADISRASDGKTNEPLLRTEKSDFLPDVPESHLIVPILNANLNSYSVTFVCSRKLRFAYSTRSGYRFHFGDLPMSKVVVLLVGPQGSGKSTYCREQLPGYVRISQDEQGRQGHFLIFEQAIREGVPYLVIDRINGLKSQRKRYLDVARQNGYLTRIVWLNVDRNLCLKRCRERLDHPTFRPEDAEKAIQLYFNSFQIPSGAKRTISPSSARRRSSRRSTM